MGVANKGDDQALALVTNRGAFKWMAISEIPTTSRARKGVAIMRELKKEPHRVIASSIVEQKAPTPLEVLTDKDKIFTINPLDHPLNQRYSNGSFVIDAAVDGAPITMEKMVNVPVVKV